MDNNDKTGHQGKNYHTLNTNDTGFKNPNDNIFDSTENLKNAININIISNPQTKKDFYNPHFKNGHTT